MTTISRSIEYLKPFIESHFSTGLDPKPLIIGISGPQGSGKSYLSSHISNTLSCLFPKLTTVDISTDDFYLTFDDQKQLQLKQPQNWIVSGRGPPSTHDLKLLNAVLDDVRSQKRGLSIPRYDKGAKGGKGDRFPIENWTHIDKQVDILIVEGWFNGFKSLPDEELIPKWQRIVSKTHKYDNLVLSSDILYINESLKKYEVIWSMFDLFIFLSTDNLNNVYDWRLDQEHSLKAHNGGLGMTDDEVCKFVDRYMPCYELYYERLIVEGCLSRGQNLKLEIDASRKLINGILI